MDRDTPGPVATSKLSSRWFVGLLAALASAVGLRIWLILSGGQFFTPDESRYEISRTVVHLLSLGRWHDALAGLLANGEHPGFKLLGLIPAWLETHWGRHDCIPALFFGSFSAVNLVLIWVIARRLGMTIAGQFWVVLLACCSVSLFFYARHIYPYDASLAVGLLAFAAGLDRRARVRRSVLVGAMGAVAFTVYLGYWFVAAAVLCGHALRQEGPWSKRLGRFLAGGIGFALVIAVVWLLSSWGRNSLAADVRNFSGAVYSPAFGSAWTTPWQYLWHAEHALFLGFLAALAFAAHAMIATPAGRDWNSVVCTGVVTIALLYGGMVVGAEVLHRSLPTGRTDRVLVPFFCLLGGWALDGLTRDRRWPAWAAVAAVGVIVWSNGRQMRSLVDLRFPREFRRRGEELIAHLPPLPSGQYYRFANVDHYNYEVEQVDAPPANILLMADHPYQFVPYLFEGFTDADRVSRERADQRMKLVRTSAPAAWRIRGESYGQVSFEVAFPPRRGGFIEPLLSVGQADSGEVFLVRYLTDTQVEFELEVIGVGILAGQTITIQPGRTYRVACFTGGLLPPRRPPAPATGDGSQFETSRSLAWMAVDGRPVFTAFIDARSVAPDDVFVGVNWFTPQTSSFEFSGRINGVVRGGVPPVPIAERVARYGPVSIRFKGPMLAVGRHEPLVAVGPTGSAVIGFITLLADGRVSFGVEYWGHGEWHSEPQALDLGQANEVTYSFGTLYPTLGDPHWASVAPAARLTLKGSVQVAVNGRAILRQAVRTPDLPGSRPEIGRNSAGGSFVSAAFSGEILSSARLPVGAKLPGDEPN